MIRDRFRNGRNFFSTASTSFEKPIPFDDFTITASPGRKAAMTSGLSSATLPCILLAGLGASGGERLHFRTGQKNDVGLRIDHLFGQRGMQFLSMFAEFEHIAQAQRCAGPSSSDGRRL
jgi:hypothetical protein